jgi:integrase
MGANQKLIDDDQFGSASGLRQLDEFCVRRMARRQRAWQAADAAGGASGALVKLLLLTGSRRNEMTELARDEIAADTIELPGERTKNGLPHTIPITPMILRELDALPSTGKFVLNSTDRPLAITVARRARSHPRFDRGRSTTFAAALQAACSGSAWLRISLNWR